MVGDIESSRSRHGIFVVDEMGAFGLTFGSGRVRGWENYHVGTEEVAVGKNQLVRVNWARPGKDG